MHLLVPNDSLYHISMQQWLSRLYQEKSYNDTMTRILTMYESIHKYCAEKGNITEDDFIIVTRPFIGQFVGKSKESVGDALEKLRQSEQIYKLGHILSDGNFSRYSHIKAFDNVWYGIFTPYKDAKPWGGPRERKICPSCQNIEGTMLHVTRSYDVCVQCGHVENDKTKEREI